MESTIQGIKDKVQDTFEEIENAENVGTNERIISGAVGLLLTFYGLKHKETLLGKGFSIVGGMLLTRATTGFCPLNQAIGRNSLDTVIA